MKTEILFRALSEYDQENYDTNGDIKCLLLKPTIDPKRISKKSEYYNLCIQGKGEYALDTVVGHVQGNKLRVETSCWISTTSSFSLACSEYAIPQAGNYNYYEQRKNVISIEVDKNKILSNSDEIKKLRQNTNLDGIFIDLRNNQLNKYYNTCILSETFNSDMPGYDHIKDINRELLGNTTSVNGFSNYATASQEVLAYKQIKNEMIKYMYTPLQQDILYGSGVITEIDNNLLSYAYQKLSAEQKHFFNLLYPTIDTGTNLTDILLQNYSFIEGENIYEKYEALKRNKYELLCTLVKIINTISKNNNLIINKVVDDGILVYSIDKPTQLLSTSSINDVIIIESSGQLYKYSHNKKEYINETGKVLEKKILTK